MRGVPPIPVVVCIDVEPDPRLVNRHAPEPWLGYEGAQRYLRALRERLEAATGAPARFSWFFRMDPQIAESYGSATWAVDRYPEFTAEILERGDEVGLHPHEYRWLDDRQVWLHDFANQPWIEHCIGTSLEAFQRAFGRPCLSFRFGDRWLNTPTINLLERAGVRYDLTVEPGLPSYPASRPGEPATGTLPDFRRVPRVPYEPSTDDFQRAAPPGSRTITMIPLTSAYTRAGWNVRAWLQRVRGNGFRHRNQSTPLSMWWPWEAPDTFERMVTRALAAQARPYLAFALRADLVVRRDLGDAVDRAFHALLAHPARQGFVFATPAAAMTMR